MKKTILFILIVFICTKGISQYTITGKITGFEDQVKFFLKDLDSGADIDSAIIKNNSFTLKGIFSESPKSLWLYSGDYYCVLLIGNEKVIITGDKKDFPLDMKITGSKIQDVRNIIARRTKNYDKQRDSLVSISVRLMQITGDSIETIQKTLWNKIYKIDSLTVVEKKKFIKEYSNSFAALQELFWQKNQFTRDSIYAIYRSLKPLYKESQYGQRIGNYLKVGDILKQGDSFSDFEALDQFGKTRKLSDFKGKYILLDFSTTYCGPCMAAADELKKLSEELKSNLTVISFSGDANKEIWMQGIRRDSPTWINLWDGKGFYGETIIKYGIQGYPTFYLISPQGKIVTNWTGYNKGLIGNMISKIINPS